MDRKLVYSYAKGHGQLINMAVYNGRQFRSDLKIGICGGFQVLGSLKQSIYK